MKTYAFWVICLSLLVVLGLGACASSPAPVEKTVYIAPQMIACPGTGSRQCLQLKDNPEDEYTSTVESIEGFEFEPGYEYQLRVLEETAAGSDRSQWRLVEVVRKLRVPSPLNDSQWSFISYANSAGELVDILSGTQITLEFTDGKISGSAGCNSYFGDFHADAARLTVDSVGSTEMFCTSPEGVMEQEMAFLEALLSADSYRIEEGNLVVLNADGKTILTFNALQPMTLTSETWEMVSINGGQGELVPALQGTLVTAIFSPEGELSGSAGCNQYGTTYILDGEQITIPVPATTRMFCSEPEGVMEQEQAYSQLLGAAVTYKIQQSTLELYDASGLLLVRFEGR